MRASRIMKLVAHVSSSSSSARAPSSRASWMLAAWLVLPLASSVRKARVSRPALHRQRSALVLEASYRLPCSPKHYILNHCGCTFMIPWSVHLQAANALPCCGSCPLLGGPARQVKSSTHLEDASEAIIRTCS